MKRAFVVMGVPSSGTRLMARVLIAGGCMGDGEHRQRWDDTPPTADTIVLRRHVPDPQRPPKWASDPNVFTALEAIGYKCTAVIISRDWHATFKSIVAAPHLPTVEAGRQLAQDVWRHMINKLPAHIPFHIVSYESLVKRPESVARELYGYLGLEKCEELEPISDGNDKYYQ